MATASTKPQPEIAGEILRLDPALIDTDEANRIGQFFPLKAEGLACRIDVDGQLEPIGVVRAGNKAKLPWKLVYGRHRLWACQSLGKLIEARVVSGDKHTLVRLQTSENLDRRRMSVLEDAMFIAAVAEAAQARVLAAHGVTSIEALGAARTNALDKSVHSAPRADGQVHFAHPGSVADEIVASDASAEIALQGMLTSYRWKPEVAAACGIDEKKVQRALRIHRQLVVPFPELMEALKEHPVADNASALLKLASIAKEGREASLRALAEGREEEAPKITPAADPVQAKIVDRVTKGLRKLDNYQRDSLVEAQIDALTIASRRRILEKLQGQLKAGGLNEEA